MSENIGLITKIYGLFYTVKLNNKYINCVLRGRIRQDKELEEYTDPAAVGDRVAITNNSDDTGTIESIMPRDNVFSRQEKGRNKKKDAIAANVDQIIIIQSFRQPKYNLRFTDRLSVKSAIEKIPAILCVNKLDLADNSSIDYIKEYYRNSGVKICLTCAITGKGISELKDCLAGKISVFTGNSGVGKSSILNYLNPDLDLRTSDISAKTNKGRHTTANVEMLEIPGNIQIIDTPGVREFGINGIERNNLGSYFYEFPRYKGKCIYNPCTHDHEPGCEVKKQVETGNISKDRHQSYLNILHSM